MTLGFQGAGDRRARAVKARDAETVIKQLVRALYAAEDYYARGNAKLGLNALVGALNAAHALSNGLLQPSEFRDGRAALRTAWAAISRLVRDAPNDPRPSHVASEAQRILYGLPAHWRALVD